MPYLYKLGNATFSCLLYHVISIIVLLMLLLSLAVHFRFIVFRPFVGEILVGTLTSSSSEGLHGNIFNYCLIHADVGTVYIFCVEFYRGFVFTVRCQIVRIRYSKVMFYSVVIIVHQHTSLSQNLELQLSLFYLTFMPIITDKYTVYTFCRIIPPFLTAYAQ